MSARRETSPIRQAAWVVPLWACLAAVGCSADATAPATKDHVITGRLGIAYEWMDGSRVLQEVELLIDGIKASAQTFPTGTDRAYFDVDAAFSDAGTHTVALRVVRQTRPTVSYGIVGGVSAYRASIGASSLVQYPVNASATLKAGESYQLSFALP